MRMKGEEEEGMKRRGWMKEEEEGMRRTGGKRKEPCTPIDDTRRKELIQVGEG